MIDVKACGAKGDNSADDRAAIQRALDAVDPGGVVYFPAGTYLIGTDTALVIPAKVSIRGEGPATVVKKSSGTNDVFTTTANDVSIADLRIEGPNNTSCDGITFSGCDRGHVARVQGTLLASTVSVGVSTSCDSVVVEDVYSESNTQQGVHFNKATRGVLRNCFSKTIGSTSQHHGFYIGNTTDQLVDNCRAESCTGSGVHVYPQTSFASARLTILGGQYKGNGTAGSGLRAGVLAGVRGSWPASIPRRR